MTTNTVERTVAVRALDAATYSQRAALRTPGDAVVVTWRQYAEREYAERARRAAAELAARGVRRSDTVALMLTNRPQFHWVDVAAMEELGSTTFGVDNVFSHKKVEHALRDANCAFVETLRRARRVCPRLTHVVWVNGGESMLSLDEVHAAEDLGFELASTWPAV